MNQIHPSHNPNKSKNELLRCSFLSQHTKTECFLSWKHSKFYTNIGNAFVTILAAYYGTLFGVNEDIFRVILAAINGIYLVKF